MGKRDFVDYEHYKSKPSLAITANFQSLIQIKMFKIIASAHNKYIMFYSMVKTTEMTSIHELYMRNAMYYTNTIKT